MAALDRDPRGRFLGELALVDATSSVAAARSGPFGETLLDENAHCHVAFGTAIPGSYTAGEGANHPSAVHQDVVLGSNELSVWGRSRGQEIDVLRDGRWQGRFA